MREGDLQEQGKGRGKGARKGNGEGVSERVGNREGRIGKDLRGAGFTGYEID